MGPSIGKEKDDFQKRTEEQHLPEKPPSGSESKLLTAKSRTPAGVSWKPQLAPMSGHLFPAALPLYHPSELCAKHNAPLRTGLSEKGSKDGTVTALGALIGADEVACGEENQNKHLGSITSSWTEVDKDSTLKLSKKQSLGTPLQLPAPRLVCQRRPPKLPQTAGSWNCWPSSPTPAYQVGLESAPSWPWP